MAFLSKKSTSAAGVAGPGEVPPLSSGRKFSSSLDIDSGSSILESVLRSYRTPQYELLPLTIPCGHTWNSAEPPPAKVVTCQDRNDEVLVVAFWNVGGGSEIGMFPLGAGLDRLRAISIIEDWHARDRSLNGIGVYDDGLLTLRPPRIESDYVDEILRYAGFPTTGGNRDAITEKISQMFVLKAAQFIGTRDPRGADAFIDEHAWQPGAPAAPFLQTILNDLAARDRGILPYMQDLPLRCRALLLEARSGTGTVWEELETAPQQLDDVGLDQGSARSVQQGPQPAPSYLAGAGHVPWNTVRHSDSGALDAPPAPTQQLAPPLSTPSVTPQTVSRGAFGAEGLRPPPRVAAPPPPPAGVTRGPRPPKSRSGVAFKVVAVALLLVIVGFLAVVLLGKSSSAKFSAVGAPIGNGLSPSTTTSAGQFTTSTFQATASSSTTAAPTTTTTTPTTTAAANPAGVPMNHYVAMLGSLTSDSSAEREAARFRSAGVAAQTAQSADIPSLVPGYWVVFAGSFDNASDALAYCRSIGRTNRDQCYASYISTNPADRSKRVFP